MEALGFLAKRNKGKETSNSQTWKEHYQDLQQNLFLFSIMTETLEKKFYLKLFLIILGKWRTQYKMAVDNKPDHDGLVLWDINKVEEE